MILLRKIICSWLLLVMTTSLVAAPMGYKGSVNSMFDVSQHYKKLETNYAYTAKDAYGIKLYQAKGSHKKVEGSELTYTHRFLRVNKPHSQLNFWLFANVGYLKTKSSNRTDESFYISPGVQLDYETKRLYSLVSHQMLRAGSHNFDITKLKAGFSFYETRYDETQPWFILEISQTNDISEKVEFVPTLRFINKVLYFEVGISTEGEPKLHLMYTF